VSFQGQEGVVVAHAAAVVADSNERAPTDCEFDVDTFGSGIHSVFHQLFDDGRRTFNNFACGDSIDDMVRKYFDSHHRGRITRILDQEGERGCRGEGEKDPRSFTVT